MSSSGATTAPTAPARRDPLPIPPYRPPSRAKWKLLWGAINFTLLGTAAYFIERFLRREAKGDKYTYWFYVLFTWRYLRFATALIGWFLYRPAKIPPNPRYRPEDVTVILPTIDPEGEDFAECIRTTCENRPHSVFVVTAGNRLEITQKAVQPYVEQFPHINFRVDVSPVASKRAQVALEIPHIQTAITIMLDDHVFWKEGFLPAILAPFEDPQVGIVGTNKKVRRLPNLPFMRRLWNLLGAIYLYRHNFEVRAANAIDGGAFVISARTCAMRTEIVKLQEYIDGYTNEMFFFGMFGPLNPDDDNYNTRFCVSKGWKVKFQYTRDAEIETTIGVVPPYRKKFFGQVQRWARTTWRSNPASLFTDGSVWAYQPVSVYTVYLTSFTNFAVLDFFLWWLFMQTPLYRTRVWGYFSERWQPVACLVLLSMFSKIVKSLGYWWRHPQDVFPFLLCQILCGYFHSWFKLWALLTFYDHAWTGR
ncbi:N-acetylglucosaminyltransferase, partial [Cladorrhinum samala]